MTDPLRRPSPRDACDPCACATSDGRPSEAATACPGRAVAGKAGRLEDEGRPSDWRPTNRCADRDGRLVVDATDCDGRLDRAPACRATVVRSLSGRAVDRIVVRSPAATDRYEGTAVALLVAASRFVHLVDDQDPTVADRTARDPLAGARAATARGDAIGAIAVETGLALTARAVGSYDDGFGPR